jgi:hypothetical protein
MSVEIAETLGKTPSTKGSSARCPTDSGIFAVAEYLEKENAKTLEQEELDPHLPQIPVSTHA